MCGLLDFFFFFCKINITLYFSIFPLTNSYVMMHHPTIYHPSIGSLSGPHKVVQGLDMIIPIFPHTILTLSVVKKMPLLPCSSLPKISSFPSVYIKTDSFALVSKTRSHSYPTDITRPPSTQDAGATTRFGPPDSSCRLGLSRSLTQSSSQCNRISALDD